MAEKKTSDVLRLQANVPETIAVKFTDGMAVASNYGGDQIMFSLCDGRKMFLPPIVAKKITDSGVQANQPFEICKREIAEGNRRRVEYQIAAIVAPPPPPPPPPARSNRAVTPISNVTRISNGNTNGNGYAHSGYTVQPADSPDSAAVECMKLAGRGAVDCALEIEAYARANGMTDFLFGADNIQKIAVSLYIDLRKGGRA